MFNFLKKSKPEERKPDKPKAQVGFEKAPNKEKTEKIPEYGQIKTMPEKFLRGVITKKEKNNFKLIIIIVFLIAIVLGFTSLMLFSQTFNNLIFGRKSQAIKDLERSPGQSLEESPSSNQAQISPNALKVVKAQATDIFEEVIGKISFMAPEELRDYELEIEAGEPLSRELENKEGKKFRIIGGVYSFSLKGLGQVEKLFDFESPARLEITYRSKDLDGISPDDLRLGIWEVESDIVLVSGVVNSLDNTVLAQVKSLPQGKIALVAEAEEKEPSPVRSEPSLEVPQTLDTDGDSLTDEEENLYNTNKAEADTDSDSYPDSLELLKLYNPKGRDKLFDSGLVKVYTNAVYGYSIFYPAIWQALGETGMKATAEAERVIFSPASVGEFVEISVASNPDKLSAQDWYLGQAPGISRDQVKTSLVAGRIVAWSLNHLTVYIGREDKIFIISYNIGVRNDANFKTTYQMMTSSFEFLPEPESSGVEAPGAELQGTPAETEIPGAEPPNEANEPG